MNDDELSREFIEIFNTTYMSAERKQNATKEFFWAIDGSPKIRNCIERTVNLAKNMKSCEDKNQIICNSLELIFQILNYHSMYVDKRLDRIERKLGIELDFGNSSQC